MEQLTFEIACKYPNAEIRMPNDDMGKIHTISRNGNIVIDRGKSMITWSAVSCQLLLKKLSSISDADLIELAKIHFKVGSVTPKLIKWVKRSIEIDAIGNLESFDFLRSRNYDLDNLIERKIAVEDNFADDLNVAHK